MLSKNSIEDVKNIINSILNLAGIGFDWSDFFTIEETFDEDYARELFENFKERDPESEKELKEFVYEYNNTCDYDPEHYIETQLKITPISKDATQAAKLLDDLNYLFYSEECYE